MNRYKQVVFVLFLAVSVFSMARPAAATSGFEQTYGCSLTFDDGFYGYCSNCSEGGNDCPFFCDDAADFCSDVCGGAYNLGCEGVSGFYVDCVCIVPD